MYCVSVMRYTDKSKMLASCRKHFQTFCQSPMNCLPDQSDRMDLKMKTDLLILCTSCYITYCHMLSNLNYSILTYKLLKMSQALCFYNSSMALTMSSYIWFICSPDIVISLMCSCCIGILLSSDYKFSVFVYFKMSLLIHSVFSLKNTKQLCIFFQFS